MTTVNENLMDLNIRHSVGVQRLGAGILKRLIPILNKADAEIVTKLLNRQPTLEGSFTSQRLQFLLRGIRDINRDAHVELGRELAKELRDLAKYEASFQADLLRRTIPVAVDIVSPSAAMLNAVVTSRPLQGRFIRDYVRDLEVGTRRRLTSAIQQGMIQGETMDQIVRRVRGTKALNYRDSVMETSRRFAGTLVRTAVNHTANAAREILYKENADIIGGVVWISTLDSRTCEVCAGYDQKEFAMDKGPRPPAHPACRCATFPRTKSWRELGIDADEIGPGERASMNGAVPATMNYNEWLKSQSAEAQDEALGPTRGALFRRGGVSVDRFTDTRGNSLNLDQLRKREAEAFERIKE